MSNLYYMSLHTVYVCVFVLAKICIQNDIDRILFDLDSLVTALNSCTHLAAVIDIGKQRAAHYEKIQQNDEIYGHTVADVCCQ